MKRKMLNSLAVLACLIMVFFMLETANRIKAEDLRYQYVIEAECSISITSGTATVESYINGKSGTTSTSVTVYLESYYNGEWHSYSSWTHTGGRKQENTDTTTVGIGIYRVRMSVTATSGGNTESFNVDGNMTWYLGN